MRRAALLALTVIPATLLLGACSSSPSHPASAPTTSTTTNVAKVAVQFYGDLSTESSAASAYLGTDGLLTTALGTLGKRIALDNAAITNNQYGTGCTISLTDPTSYTDCLSSEQQTAANARTDEANAQSQAAQDVTQYDSAVGTYQAALTTFVGQLIALPWPTHYNEAVNAVVTTARALRDVLSEQASVTLTTPSATVSSYDAQNGVDAGNFNDAVNALKAELEQGITS